jgi:hypothetical protein
MSKTPVLAITTATVVFLSTGMGCARSLSGPPSAPAGEPRVSWIIMSGDSDTPDREFSCQSDPRVDCEVPASRPGTQSFSDVHFYFHPTAVETKYTGSIRIGFFEGAEQSQEVRPNLIVKPGKSVERVSVVGLVTATPGAYVVPIVVEATPIQGGKAQQIRDQVRVIVK